MSALRLSRQTGVSWIAAHRMLRKMRHAMADRDSRYRLGGLVELDDAFIGGKRTGGKSGGGVEGKTPVLVAVESRKISAGVPGRVRLSLQLALLGARAASAPAQRMHGPQACPAGG